MGHLAADVLDDADGSTKRAARMTDRKAHLAPAWDLAVRAPAAGQDTPEPTELPRGAGARRRRARPPLLGLVTRQLGRDD
jgi:hypothetical protein